MKTTKRSNIYLLTSVLMAASSVFAQVDPQRGQPVFTAPVQSPPPGQSLHPMDPMAPFKLSVENMAISAKERRMRLRERAAAALASAAQSRGELLRKAHALGIPAEVPTRNGVVAPLVGITDNGEPMYLAPRDVAAADTVSADNAWPTGTAPWTTGQTGYSLSGSSQILGLWDPSGKVRTTHSQLSPRVTQGDGASTIGAHATAVAGVLASAGATANTTINGVTFNIGQYSRGTSYGADVVSYDTTDLFAELDFEASNLMKVTTHSYGPLAGWDNDGLDWIWWGATTATPTEDWKFGAYINAIGSGARQFDAFAYDAPYTLLIFAASNVRNYGPGAAVTYYFPTDTSKTNPQTATRDWNNGDAGGYDSLTTVEAAKNVLSVGGVYDIQGGYSGPSSVVSATFSGMGPTDDGRIKPDVVAPAIRTGTVTATWNPFGFTGLTTLESSSDTSYTVGAAGNSVAAPDVAGGLGLVLQKRDIDRPEWIGNAWPIQSSTLRGLAIHTADEAGAAAGPDYKFGWGLFNAASAATLMHNDITSGSSPSNNGPKPFLKEILLPHAGDIEFKVRAASSSTPLKVTICWTDVEGPSQTSGSVDQTTARLVNDLDLRVVTPSATTLSPFILDPALSTKSDVTRALAATTGDDNRNNVEQIVVASPTTTGDYIVKVTHKGTLSGGQQWVSVLISGNTVPAVNFQVTNIYNAGNGDYVITYNTVPGAVYRIVGSANAGGPYVEETGDIVATHESTATLVHAPNNSPMHFWQVGRYY